MKYGAVRKFYQNFYRSPHPVPEFLLTFWDVVPLIPPSDLHLGRPQPPCERKLLNLQYARYQSLSK